MAQIIFTPKTASYGVLAGLPVVDVSTTCEAINPTYYQALVGTLSPAVVVGQYMIVKVTVQNAVGATVRTLRITKSDGVTVLLQFDAVSQPALPLATTTLFSARVVIGSVSDWTNVQLQVSSNTATDVVIIKATSLVFAFAETCNIVDLSLVKLHINNIYFMTMQPVQEAVLGKVGSASDIAFLTVPVNSMANGFRWDANSGMTLYSWDGSSIGLGV